MAAPVFWMANTRRSLAGFTLTELMIVVAIIGVLASIAIPGFQRYQQTSKRSEAYTNLAALANAQKSYFAETNRYVASLPEPSNTSGVDPHAAKRDGSGLHIAFANVGWVPTGDVAVPTISDGSAWLRIHRVDLGFGKVDGSDFRKRGT